jgi:hypothetical protein
VAESKDYECIACKHWSRTDDGGHIYNARAIERNPQWVDHGLCEHPFSKMRPLWEGAEAIATDPDFGCVQFEVKECLEETGKNDKSA